MSDKLKKNIRTEIFDTVKTVIIAVIIAFLINHLIIANAQIPTGSMEPTVMSHSRIIINRLAYIGSEPQRGDIVSFYCPDKPDTLYLKRILGLPGETIQGVDGVIYINGVPFENDYTDIAMNEDFDLYTIPDDCYFMIGDNRNNSFDSRYWTNHFVEKDDIIGKALLEYYPSVEFLN